MKKNIGTLDRLARLIIGCALIVLGALQDNSLIATILALLGLICIYQSARGWCFLYALLGKNTCPIENR
jgi:uncharacterized membrane protein